jgi:hypothetical protein
VDIGEVIESQLLTGLAFLWGGGAVCGWFGLCLVKRPGIVSRELGDSCLFRDTGSGFGLYEVR